MLPMVRDWPPLKPSTSTSVFRFWLP
jgi:hypothetical protein